MIKHYKVYMQKKIIPIRVKGKLPLTKVFKTVKFLKKYISETVNPILLKFCRHVGLVGIKVKSSINTIIIVKGKLPLIKYFAPIQ